MESAILHHQPSLTGPTLLLRPLESEDFDALYRAASDPLIWQQHPSPLRYQRPVFLGWFDDALASQSALVVVHKKSGQIIGSSRYYDWTPENKEIAIGFTFLTRAFWGGATNAELKRLMLEYAFQEAHTVWFHIAPHNWRSRKAMEKIGGQFSHQGMMKLTGGPQEYCFYKIERSSFQSGLSLLS
jgi:RimJ/RimL family protein N-acetyltransferase